MNFAIIAAGEGSRLIREGCNIPKPLIEINGFPLIDRLISVFVKNKASAVSIIINEEMDEVREYVKKIKVDFPLHLQICSTPGSMHSFHKLSRFLPDGKFCLTTIDAVFREEEFTAFIRTFEQDSENDGMMAVTRYVDDEKPLYVLVDDETMMINGFKDVLDDNEKYVSGGIYGLVMPQAIQTLNKCLDAGMLRMRDYQRQLIADGLKLKAYPFEKIIDVDHVSDIAKAEKLLVKTHKKLKVAGIRRDERFSPNHIENDAAIFDLTVRNLKGMNCEVTEYLESEFLESDIDADVIFNMARDMATILKLQDLERQGKKVINSGYGIANCACEKMTYFLSANNIPHPESLIVQTDKPFLVDLAAKHFWVKKGGFHTNYENVVYAENVEIVENIIREYALQNIPVVVINEHIKGDLVKFYGVKSTGFFYWIYPNELNHSKFGLESINGKVSGIPFDEEYLEKISNKAAEILNVDIYGGDCVVDETGDIRIIDFNDWPSFASCRTVAAVHIAQCIYEFATEPK
jgi:NDP-sugar pyrophosphorylase family protein